MKKHIILFICFLVGFTVISIHAQQGFTGEAGQGFTGQIQTTGLQGFSGQTFGSSQPVMAAQPLTVNDARALPHDSFVILNGNIVNALPGGKYYTFRDPSGEIIIDIGQKHWRGLSVAVSDQVVIYGEIKINRGQSSIKVHAISGSGRTNAWQGQAVFINRPITIGEARTLPHDSFVILNGNIVNMLSGKNSYTFRDTSGEITVDIGQKHWRGLSVGASDRVELYGEVKIHRGMVIIKVHAIRAI